MQLEGITNYMTKSLTCAHGGGVGGVGEGRGSWKEQDCKGKAKQSPENQSQKWAGRGQKKIEKSLEKIPKITPKSDENHSKKGLGKLREARKWARVAKKRSKSDLRWFLDDFWTVRGALGEGLGAPKRAQERPSGAQEAPKSVPRALWKASCVKVCFDIDFVSFFYRFWDGLGIVS